MATNQLALRDNDRMTAADIRANVNLIQEVMKAVMTAGVHYGTIPGCGDKPALFKPGAEKILATFRISVEPVVTDLSTPGVARYRVEARGVSASGQYLGSGIGEASSEEEKYAWRGAVCEQEYEATPVDQRREKWKKSRDGAYSIKQVKTNPADIANTVLKMAKKRAQIDMTLTVTAASDCFEQDIEDMPEEVAAEMREGQTRQRPAVPQVQRRSAPAQVAPAPASGNTISEAQAKRFYAKYKAAGWKDDDVKGYLKANLNIEHSRDIPRDLYDALIELFEKPPQAQSTAPDGQRLDFDQEQF